MVETVQLADLDGETWDAVEEFLLRMADDEFVLAERYTEWQVVAPTLESDLALSNVAQDELGHARIWYDALERMGHTEQGLVWERDPGDFRHSTLVELPFEEGDWGDAILRGYLFDVAEDLRLQALEDASIRGLADPIDKIRSEEEYHLTHAQNWLERLCDDAEGRAAVQSAANRLFPHALTLFAPAEHESTLRELGLRDGSLESVRADWIETVAPFLESLGVEVPVEPGADLDAALPDAVGRDGRHTDHWPDLHAEFTGTYRELDRSEVRRLRGDS